MDYGNEMAENELQPQNFFDNSYDSSFLQKEIATKAKLLPKAPSSEEQQ